MRRDQLGGKTLEQDARKIRVLTKQAESGSVTTGIDHGNLSGLADDDHPQYVHLSTARTITAAHTFSPPSAGVPFSLGANAQGQLVTGLNADQLDGLHAASYLAPQFLALAADANLTNERVFTPGDGLDGTDSGAGAAYTLAVDVTDLLGTGLSEDGSNNITLPTPGTVTVSSTNAAAAPHTHAVTSSSNPGAAASLLASDASGYLQLVRLGAGTAPATLLHALGTSEQLRLSYDAGGYASFTVADGGGLTLATTTDDATGNLTMAPAGDIVFNPTGNDLLPATGYDLNIGSLAKKYLTLHAAELWVETLVAQNTIATIGGRILVGPTTTLTVDLTDVATQMTVKHNEMTYGDTAYLEANGAVEFILIGGYAITAVDVVNDKFTISGAHLADFPVDAKFTIVGSTGNDGEWTVKSVAAISDTVITVKEDVTDATVDGHILYTGAQGTGPFKYLSVTRNRDGSGANAWYAGDAVFNSGAANDGWIDLYSVGGVAGVGAGPTIVGNVRNSSTYNDWDEHWAIGNLNGLYGYGASDVYGAAFGEYATNKPWIGVDSTNGFRVMRYTTQLAQWDTSGNILVGQTGASQSNVYITSGAVKLRTNAVVHVDLQADGDVFIGPDISAAATTSLCIFTNAQTYNSESVGANDILIGDNSAAKANILWDYSAGKLLFRGGSTTKAYLDTTGAITAGGGEIVLDDDSLKIYSESKRIRMFPAGGAEARETGFYLNTPDGDTLTCTWYMQKDATPTYWAAVDLNTSNQDHIFVVRSSASSELTVDPDGDLAVAGSSGDVRVYGGLALGSVAVDPDATSILFTAEISDPSAPAANRAVVYIRDNGSGKTQLCARFASGAVQVLATEP